MFSDSVLGDKCGDARKFSLSRVALFGGGRWSRVLLPVMQSLLSDSTEIAWITQHGNKFARHWLSARAFERVTVTSEIALSSGSIDAAVVATAPAMHARQVRQLLEQSVPTLCEKPLVLEFQEAVELEKLSRDIRCPLGVNLELTYANYLHEFSARLEQTQIHDISIRWYDPWTEQRYGETKHGDVYTCVVDDMWPHCWSLLRGLCPSLDRPVLSLESVRYEPRDGQVDFTVRLGDRTVHVALGRRFTQRVRRIEVNGGEFVLDFSIEPGWAKFGSDVSQNQWQGARPLSRSMGSFFGVVTNPSLASHWPLAVSGCLDSVRIAQTVGLEVRRIQEARVDELRRIGVSLIDSAQRNLLVDLELPRLAALGRRWPAITVEEQIAFLKHVCESQGICYH